MLGGYGCTSAGMPEVKAARQVDQFEEGAVALLAGGRLAAVGEGQKNCVADAEHLAAAHARNHLLSRHAQKVLALGELREAEQTRKAFVLLPVAEAGGDVFEGRKQRLQLERWYLFLLEQRSIRAQVAFFEPVQHATVVVHGPFPPRVLLAVHNALPFIVHAQSVTKMNWRKCLACCEEALGH